MQRRCHRAMRRSRVTTLLPACALRAPVSGWRHAPANAGHREGAVACPAVALQGWRVRAYQGAAGRHARHLPAGWRNRLHRGRRRARSRWAHIALRGCRPGGRHRVAIQARWRTLPLPWCIEERANCAMPSGRAAGRIRREDGGRERHRSRAEGGGGWCSPRHCHEGERNDGHSLLAGRSMFSSCLACIRPHRRDTRCCELAGLAKGDCRAPGGTALRRLDVPKGSRRRRNARTPPARAASQPRPRCTSRTGCRAIDAKTLPPRRPCDGRWPRHSRPPRAARSIARHRRQS